MNLFKEEKGQSSLEVLLLIAGAILIASIIGVYLKSLQGQIQPILNNQTGQVIHQIN